MNWEFIVKYLPLYQKAAVLTLKIGIAGIILSFLIGLFCVAVQNPGYTVGIPSLGSQDTIAPAVSKGNETLLNWINEEIKSLAGEEFFHKDYEETLADTYGLDYEESLVVEGGEPTV